jgi:maltooligosyltrehalose trehalohydrolase
MQTFAASKLDWPTLERSDVSRRFRALTRDLLEIRRANIVPLLKEGVVGARAELLDPRDGSLGGLHVQWHTAHGRILQIVTNFAEQPVLRPPLVEGETLWGAEPGNGHLYQYPADILVRLGGQ